MASKTVTPKDTIKRNKSLAQNYKKATNTYHPHLDYIIYERDVGHWWCRIRDLAGEFSDGEYLIEMFAPDNFPFGPPKFLVRTPNGVYATGVDVCVGIGHFHKDEFAAGQGGMMGFMCQLLTGLMLWKELSVGIGILHPEYFYRSGYTATTAAEKVALDPALAREKGLLASRSTAHNREKYPKLMAEFDRLPLPTAVKSLPRLGLTATMERRMRRAICGE